MASIITLAVAQAKLTELLAAQTAVTSGQSYSIETGDMRRTLTRADLPAIVSAITYWQNWEARLLRKQAQRSNTRYVVPSGL